MNVVVFGANGGTGKALVDGALAKRYAVTAFVRDPSSLQAREGLRIVQGDALDAAAVSAAIAGQDAVLSALGSRSIGKSDLLDRASANIITGMNEHRVKRLIVLGAAGALHDPTVHQSAQRKIFFTLIKNTLLKNPLADSGKQERRIEASDLEYTIVHPPRLLDDPAAGKYRVDPDGLPVNSDSISRADVADFMLRCLADNIYVRQGPYISN